MHLPFGIDAAIVATWLSAAAAMAVAIAFYAAITARDPMAKRVKALNERREQLKAGITASTRRQRASLTRSNQNINRMRMILASLKVLQDTQLKEAQKKLMQAGIRSKDVAVTVIFARLALPIVVGSVSAIAVYGFGALEGWGSIGHYGVVAGSLILSYKAPDIYLKNRVTKRADCIRKGMPDALDLLVICAEAGLTVDSAFARVSRELGKSYPELADEFALTAIELGFLTDRRIAFENLANRVQLEALRGVVTTMIQTEKYGTPLASALRVLSSEFRHDRMMRAEEKAARLPAVMTVPLIMFILPVLFIVILGPAACSISDNFMKT
jgi:tight adherence protein C